MSKEETDIPTWEETVNQQGWNETSQIIHLEAFIRSKDLEQEFNRYAAEIAEEENQDYGAPQI